MAIGGYGDWRQLQLQLQRQWQRQQGNGTYGNGGSGGRQLWQWRATTEEKQGAATSVSNVLWG